MLLQWQVIDLFRIINFFALLSKMVDLTFPETKKAKPITMRQAKRMYSWFFFLKVTRFSYSMKIMKPAPPRKSVARIQDGQGYFLKRILVSEFSQRSASSKFLAFNFYKFRSSSSDFLLIGMSLPFSSYFFSLFLVRILLAKPTILPILPGCILVS